MSNPTGKSTKKFTYEFAKSIVENAGYKLLSNEYINTHSKMKFECPKGHIYKTEFNHFKKGIRCPRCGGTGKLSYEYVKQFIEKEGYVLLDKEYKNNLTKINLRCPKEHIFKIKFNHFKRGQRCKKCFKKNRIKYDYEYVKSYIEEYGYKLLSKEYINYNTVLTMRCPNGHIRKTKFYEFKRYDCVYCSRLTSSIEEEFKSLIKQIFAKHCFLENKRIEKREADIIIDNKFAINFHGDYWHCNPNLNKKFSKPNYIHNTKRVTAKQIWKHDEITKQIFENNGFKYLVIWENDWKTKREFCINEIQKLVGVLPPV